jgi:Leucine-rich repeat (LRR) protein
MYNQLTALLFACTFSWLHSHGQYTLVPDNIFEQRLIDQGIDSEGILNGQVLTSDIEHITSLDVVTQFPEFDPTISDLTGIEDFTDLEYLNFGSNTIEQVDLSQNLNLITLVCKFNNLTSLDVSNNLLLEVLDVVNCPEGTCEQQNVFTSIDLSANANLQSIAIGYNYFTELDFSLNSELISAAVVGCPELFSLNLKNGNNTNLFPLIVSNNPLLNCITVDDPLAANQGDTYPYDQWNIQEGIVFSEDCSLGIEEAISAMFTIYPNPTSNLLTIQNTNELEIESVSLYDTLGRKVMESNESTESIDVSNLTAGIYFIHIATASGTVTKKIIKE